ncbi:dermokine [Rhynchocyon petersi]
MKPQELLACLLAALLLGSGDAGPLLSGGGDPGASVGEAIGHEMGDAISQGVGEAIGKEAGGAASSGVRQAVGHGLGEATGYRIGEAVHQGVGEAAHALGNTGGEASRQAENAIRHGIDLAHGYWQGAPGSNGAWGTNGQPPYGGPSISGAQSGYGGHSQGNLGGPGSPWGQEYPVNSDGSFGTNSQGGSWGLGNNGRPVNVGSNTQDVAARPSYNSVRGSGGSQNNGCTNPKPTGSSESNGGKNEQGSSGPNWDRPLDSGRNFDQGSYSDLQGSNRGSSSSSSGGHNPECDNPENEIRMSGGSGGQGQGSSRESGRGEAINGVNTLNSEASQGVFNFDTFWKNFKSKLGFINWDAIDKNQIPRPSARALLYFSRLWEDFKHNTPFLNWKAITEGADVSSVQKRAVDDSQKYNYNQQSYPGYGGNIPAKGGVTVASSVGDLLCQFLASSNLIVSP